MNYIALWRDEDIETSVRLMYAGDAVVLESKGSEGSPLAHYFETRAEALDFMIRSAYALLSLGYKVVE